MAEENTLNPWVKASVLSYIIIAILNFIIVILKETSPKGGGTKQFMIDFGGALGIAHHLYGHIMLLLILYVIFLLVFVYTPLNDAIGNILKLNDYDMASWYMIGSTILSAGVIMIFMYIVAFVEEG